MKVRKHNIGNGRAQRNGKVDSVENEIIENKRLVKDLRTDAERLCVKYDKF